MKAAIIHNRFSRYNLSHLSYVDAIAEKHGMMRFILDKDMLAHPAHIQAIIAKIVDSGITTLCINGGDGTLDLIITSIRNSKYAAWQPDILLLRGGTTNMTHRDVGYGANPAQALAKACRRAFELSVTKRHVMRVSSSHLASAQYGFFLGTQAIAQAIKHTRTHHHSRNKFGARSEAQMLFSSISALIRGSIVNHAILSPTSLDFSYQNRQMQASHITFIATTLERLLLRLTLVKPKQQIGCLLLQTPCVGILGHIPSLWTGSPDRDSGALLRWRDDSITCAFTGDFTIDGELHSTHADSPITIEKSEAVSFLQ